MLVTTLRQIHCSLDNYQGPLECLYQLVLRREIDIRDVTLRQVALQFVALFGADNPQTLEVGAEFVGTLAAMMLLKSRSLLPLQPTDDSEEMEPEGSFEILQKLVEYCRIKNFAKELSVKEANQGAHYNRGLLPIVDIETPPSLGIEHLSLDDLSSLFSRVLQSKHEMKAHVIQDEEWKVSDALIFLRKEFLFKERLTLEEVFSPERCRLALIVTFLAILELMKGGEVLLTRELESGQVWINRTQPEESTDNA